MIINNRLLKIVFCVLACCFIFCSEFVPFSVHANGKSNIELIDKHTNKYTYDKYYDANKEKPIAKKEIKSDDITTHINYKSDVGGVVLKSGENVKLVFSNVTDEMYAIEICYATLQGEGRLLEYSIAINESTPFDECKTLNLKRKFIDPQEDFLLDRDGNQLQPVLEEELGIQNNLVKDSSGYYSMPYNFLFNDGDNNINITCLGESFAIVCVTLKPLEEKGYKQYLKENDAKGAIDVVPDNPIIIQAEHPIFQNDKALTTLCDKTSVTTLPTAYKKQVQNVFGGNQWSIPGQSATWEFDVEQDGYYEVCIKERQDFSGGLFVNRRLYIDGEVPFKEVSTVKIPYKIGWNNVIVGNQSNRYKFYLSKGKHTITLECVLGDMEPIIRDTQELVSELNAVYRRIIMITSSTPDPLRDYLLDKKIPEIFSSMEQIASKLDGVSQNLIDLTGKRSSENSILDDISLQLKKFIDNPSKISGALSRFQGNISSLGTWIYSRYVQPMEIDYIHILGVGENPPKTNANFFKQMGYSFMQFLYSFLNDYDLEINKEVISVWVPSGRDQAQIIKRLSEDYFSNKFDIIANTKLVSPDALLPAIVAGIGPDVALLCNNKDPVNYATRKAVVDLSKFPEYEKIETQFYKSAITPFKFNGGIYAIPESQSFPVMFYREDVLNELKIKVPSTWTDVYKTIAELQRSNMQMGIPSGIGGFSMFLYQNGGEFYSDNGAKSALNSKVSVKSFEIWTDLFGDYQLPLAFDFANRFRSGEMPIAIADYTSANQLSVFAPEIKELWKMAPIPGTLNKEGVIDRSATSTGTGAIILKNTKHLEASWEFVKWWTSADIQGKFGKQVEDKLGATARYPAANVAAFDEIPWSSELSSVIKEQWTYIKGTPEVPGGYFTPRHLDNAFRKVVYAQSDILETLNEYVGTINNEIKEKRIEFGLQMK